MSQRLPNHINSTNHGAMQYDVYNQRLRKFHKPVPAPPSKSVPVRNGRETASSKSKLTMQSNAVPMALRSSRITQLHPIKDNKMQSGPTTPPNVYRKDLYPNNGAMVEVTAKAQKNLGNKNKNNEPWGKLLQGQASADDVSSFNHFDPLRTIHFLSKELQLKMIQKMPTDYTVLQMLDDMQQALHRVPPDILAILQMQTAQETKELTDSPRTTESSYVKPQLSEKGVQTAKSSSLIVSERLHKHIEQSSVKIEAACSQMEAVCTKLKAEKGDLEESLKSERDQVNQLKEQLTTLENNAKVKEEELTNTIKELNNQKETLETQIKKLNAQLENQQSVTSEDLKSVIHELRRKKSDAEKESMIARHQLTLTNMENEKLTAIISTRDRHINEMRIEMKQLQEVVNEQIVEFQNVQCSTACSSVSTLTDSNMWNLPEKDNLKENETDDNNVANVTAVEKKESEKFPELLMNKQSSSTCKVMVSGDRSSTSNVVTNMMLGEVDDIFNKDTNGDSQYKKNAAPKFITNCVFDNNTTTTPYENLPDDPIRIKNLIEDVKKQALSLAPIQQRRELDDIYKNV